MSVWNPNLQIAVTDVPSIRGVLRSPPVAFHVAAEAWNAEAGSSIDGRFLRGKGEAQAAGLIKPQDTFISGTASRTGRPFTVVSGTWKDDYINPRTGKYELLRPDSASAAFDIHSTATTPKIEAAEIVLRRGLNPTGNTATRGNYFCFLEFVYGSQYNYRFGCEWGQPFHLDFTMDSGATWKQVALAEACGNADAYLHANNDEVRLQLLPDYNDGTFVLIVGGRDMLYHQITGSLYGTDRLPVPGRLRLSGSSGWVSLGYYPLRHGDLVITKSVLNLGEVHANAGQALVAINQRGVTDPTQETIADIQTDGQRFSYTLTAALPDSGDALGSVDPAKLIDATLVIPAKWEDSVGGLVNPNTQIAFVPGMNMQLLEVLDDATRTRSSSCLIPINNWNLRFGGTFAHAAVSVVAGNGVDPNSKAFEGIGGVGERGWSFDRSDPVRLLHMPCADYSFAMQIELDQEVCFDGWYIGNAVQFLCENGNCHPNFISGLPPYTPPGMPSYAPYGAAGSDLPPGFFQLARGTGLNAKYKFLPGWTPWAILQLLVQDAGETDPITGANIPYYMGFNENGIFYFGTFNPHTQFPVAFYSDVDNSGYGMIEEFHLFNSVAQMRTSIDLQGIDAWSNELLYYHLPLSDDVLRAVGFRFPWLDRSARYSSYAYMAQIAQSAAVQASLPTQVIVMRVPYHPYVHAGNVILVSEGATLGRAGLFYITEIRSRVGLHDLTGRSGYQSSFSYITARAVENF